MVTLTRADGTWAGGLHEQPGKVKTTDLCLYRIDELQKADVVFICEGEKAVNRLIDECGLAATCPPSTATAWVWSRALLAAVGLDTVIVVLADNDPKGRTLAEAVAADLATSGASDVRVLLLPELLTISLPTASMPIPDG